MEEVYGAWNRESRPADGVLHYRLRFPGVWSWLGFRFVSVLFAGSRMHGSVLWFLYLCLGGQALRFTGIGIIRLGFYWILELHF